MLNAVEIVARIQELMKKHTLSAAAFAEKIGVQRSLVSHVLSGRNKPSLDFLAKVEHAFSEVDFIWLLKGEHLPLSPPPRTKQPSDAKDEHQQTIEESPLPEQNSSVPPNPVALPKPNHAIPSTIVHYYPDGSFDVFHKR